LLRCVTPVLFLSNDLSLLRVKAWFSLVRQLATKRANKEHVIWSYSYLALVNEVWIHTFAGLFVNKRFRTSVYTY